MEAGGGLMTVLGAIISGHKNKCWYEWKSFATILSLCPRHRLGSERRAAVNCKIIYFKKSRQPDWYLILTNDLSFKFFKEQESRNICCLMCSRVESSNSGLYLQNTSDVHSVITSLSRSQSFCYSPSIYYLKVNIKWQVSDRLFRCCEKIELTRKAGLKVCVSPSLSESGSRPFQCGKTYKSRDLD